MLQDLDLSLLASEGRLDCTVALKHPFPGLDKYDGFDVWGVFINNGSKALQYQGLAYADLASGTDAILLNPDGYTRWYNQPEFDGDGPPILEYWPGKLSNLPDPTAQLNPYRIFADGLGVEDDYYEWISDPGNSLNRGIFTAGQVNSRRYEMKFPFVGGSPKVSFQYAIVASWEPGDPTLTGNPSTYEPGDFPSSANCDEAFFMSLSTARAICFMSTRQIWAGHSSLVSKFSTGRADRSAGTEY